MNATTSYKYKLQYKWENSELLLSPEFIIWGPVSEVVCWNGNIVYNKTNLNFFSIVFAVCCIMGNVEYPTHDFCVFCFLMQYSSLLDWPLSHRLSFLGFLSPLCFCIVHRICIPKQVNNHGICVWAPLVSCVDFIPSILLF